MTTPGHFLPPGLVSNLQDALKKKQQANNYSDTDDNNDKSSKDDDESTVQSSSNNENNNINNEFDPSKPVIFITNSEGIDSPGLIYLIEALVQQGLYNVSVCAPQL